MSVTSHRTAWLRGEIFDALRSNSDLVELLDYDPAADRGPESKIYEVDPPDNRRPPIAVTVDVQPDSGGPNNKADDLSWSVQIAVEATEDWYESHYGRDTRQRIFDELVATLERPSISGLRNRRHVGFARTEPQVAANVSRQWTAEFHYEATWVHKQQD